MVRFALIVAVLAAAGSVARAQDEIRYIDRVKRVEMKGEGAISEENAGKVVYKHTTGSREIPAADVIDIAYAVRPALSVKVRSIRTKESNAEKAKEADRKKLFGEVIKEYKDMASESADNPRAARHFEYKIARIQARLADDDKALRKPAIDALQAFRKKHADCWQLTNATKLLTGLLNAEGNHAAAAQALDGLAAAKNVARDTKQWAELEAAQALVHGKQFKEAKTRLDAALKGVKPDDPQVTRVQLYMTSIMTAQNQLDEAIKMAEGILNKVTDPKLKAAAHNALGDCYLASKKPKEALWQYLWVDVVYNDDKTEHVKAMQNIAKIFEDMKDDARAKQYRDRLGRLQ